MSEVEERLSGTEVNENDSGVVLGYWDHEKTPTLIQDLEQSINSVELKCKKLLEELTYYKKYLEKPGEIDFHLAVFKKKSKKLKNSVFSSGSEPEVAFRKNCIHFQKIKHVFEEKFREKLRNINKDLKEAAYKIGLRDNIILFPANDYLKKLREEPECMEEFEVNEEKEEEEEEADEEGNIREKFIELSTLKAKTKSDSLITDNDENSDFSKITKNQLELYQKLSRLSMKKRRVRKLKIKRKKIKFFLKKRTLKYRQVFQTSRDKSKKSKPGVKALKKRKNKIAVLLGNRSLLAHDCDSTEHSRDSKIHQSSADVDARDSNKPRDESTGNEKGVAGSPALGVALKKTIPFTACTSTSRSYNIGLNMQQLLSLAKYRRKADVKISASEKIHGGGRATNVDGLISKPSVADVKKRRSTPWTHSQTKNNSLDNEEHGRNNWASELLTSSNYRKVRCRTTGPNGIFKYLKSTTSQFTNGQKSMIQSESKTAYAVGSKIMVSDCQRTDIFEIGKINGFKNASGDGKSNNSCAELNLEWAKVYNSFLEMYRKYSYLKEKVSGNASALANEELKSLEKDIDFSIEKYKEFLQFYTKFLHMNHRLKSLKIACETKTFKPVTSVSSNCQRKMWGYKPTHSMAMKDTFREVQALQAKINLVQD